jgi:HPP family
VRGAAGKDAALRERLLAAIRVGALAGVTILVIGMAGQVTGWLLVTSTLGPTAYFLFVHRRHRWSSMRNAVTGHSVGLGAGLAGLWLTGNWHVGGAFYPRGLPIAFAVAIAVALTLIILTAVGIHHPPAASTTVLVAVGLAAPGRPLAGLVLGLVALFVLALALNAAVPAPAAWEREMSR